MWDTKLELDLDTAGEIKKIKKIKDEITSNQVALLLSLLQPLFLPHTQALNCTKKYPLLVLVGRRREEFKSYQLSGKVIMICYIMALQEAFTTMLMDFCCASTGWLYLRNRVILMIFWDFSTGLGFTQYGPIKREYPMSSTSLGENASLMSEENELTGRQQWLKYLLTQGIQKSVSERTTPQTFKQMTCSRRPHWPHS